MTAINRLMLLCMIGLFILELKVFENRQCNVKKNNMLNVKKNNAKCTKFTMKYSDYESKIR